MYSLLLADDIDLTPPGNWVNVNRIQIGSVVSALVTLVLIIAALAFFFFLVWGGIKYITSGGDKGQTEAARAQITAAVIGLFIVFATWAIIRLMDTFFGVNILHFNLPTFLAN